ncbi:YceI family protein [Phenylobacterium sp. LjRoot219]|uniref:YceI family protein n=1 Tax=Phenylobacterium sp. LjRoot219 TaxID=3342283 RepID=UPI003ECD0852
MRLTAVVLALALVAAGPLAAAPQSRDPAQVPAGEYVLDKPHASLIARVPHLGFSRYTLRFNRLDGRFAYDPANWRNPQVTFEADAASVDTGDKDFDRQIAGYFDAAAHPKITFQSRALEVTGEGTGKLTGDLTLRGVTHPVTLDVVFNGVGPGMMGGGTRLGFSGTGRINRSDFGVTEVKQFVGDEVDLQFELEFFRK